MNEVKEIFVPEKAVCREMSIKELHAVVTSNYMIRAATWSFTKPTIMVKDKCYRFRVSGHHHKGHVYIILNGLDLFDIYFTSIHGVIKKIKSDVYVMDLVDTLDNEIERLPEYTQ